MSMIAGCSWSHADVMVTRVTLTHALLGGVSILGIPVVAHTTQFARREVVSHTYQTVQERLARTSRWAICVVGCS